MKCPRDGTELAQVTLLGMELDKCHQCDGIWCDRGELDSLRAAKVEDIEEVLERKYGDPEYQEGDVDARMRCPRCGSDTRLLERHYTYVNPVKIDQCQKCYGMWLDDGELNAIIGEHKGLDEAKDEGRLKAFLHKVAGLFQGEDAG